MKAAGSLGLTFPLNVLGRADEVKRSALLHCMSQVHGPVRAHSIRFRRFADK